MNLQISPAQQKCAKKLTLALHGGAVGVLGVHLQIFPVNYAKKIFFTALRGAGEPTAPLATPMFQNRYYKQKTFNKMSVCCGRVYRASDARTQRLTNRSVPSTRAMRRE